MNVIKYRSDLLEVPSSFTSWTILRTLCVNLPTRLVLAETYKVRVEIMSRATQNKYNISQL